MTLAISDSLNHDYKLEEFMAEVPKTSFASNSFYYCQHGIDTRWFNGKCPCNQCLSLKRMGMKHTWPFPMATH